MNIAILSRNKNLYSTKRLVEAAEQRGHKVQVIDIIRCYMNMACNRPEIHLAGEKLVHR
jgi:ribosomal protein S6--L-glutamate ligase